MNQSHAQESSALSSILDKFAAACGFLAAFVFVNPAYIALDPFFDEFLMRYVPSGYFNLFNIVLLITLFFVILAGVRVALLMVASFIGSMLSVIAIKFTLWRHERKH